MNIQLGSIIVYKGNGLVFQLLSRLLKFFERDWDKWGWHMSVVVGQEYNDWIVIEAVSGGVRKTRLTKSQGYTRGVRVYNWLDEFDAAKAGTFAAKHTGQKYDIAVYFWTTLGYLARKAWGRPIPRLFDDRWSCWELVYYFCDRMGKPLAESYDFPLITDFLKAVKSEP
jgi:hypothetical protein